jgi:hypothetical protein
LTLIWILFSAVSDKDRWLVEASYTHQVEQIDSESIRPITEMFKNKYKQTMIQCNRALCYRMFYVQIETAQRAAFTLVLDEVIFSRRWYIGSLDDQLISEFVGLDWKAKKTGKHLEHIKANKTPRHSLSFRSVAAVVCRPLLGVNSLADNLLAANMVPVNGILNIFNLFVKSVVSRAQRADRLNSRVTPCNFPQKF